MYLSRMHLVTGEHARLALTLTRQEVHGSVSYQQTPPPHLLCLCHDFHLCFCPSHHAKAAAAAAAAYAADRGAAPAQLCDLDSGAVLTWEALAVVVAACPAAQAPQVLLGTQAVAEMCAADQAAVAVAFVAVPCSAAAAAEGLDMAPAAAFDLLCRNCCSAGPSRGLCLCPCLCRLCIAGHLRCCVPAGYQLLGP